MQRLSRFADRVLYFGVMCLCVFSTAALANGEEDTVLGTYTDPGQGQAPALAATISAQMNTQIGNTASLLGLSSAGVLFYLDRSGPVEVVEGLDNLGSFFSEPPWSLGEGRLSIGLNYTWLDFQESDGISLDKIFDYIYVDRNGARLADPYLDLDAQVLLAAANYGITDKLDLGIVLPYIWLHGEGYVKKMDGTVAEGTSFDEHTEGVGDTLLRAKYEILKTDDLLCWSLGLDMKFPTGKEELYHGTGHRDYRARTLLGKKIWRLFPSAEVGYKYSGLGGDFHAFDYRVALPMEITKRLTIGPEVLGNISESAQINDFALSARFAISNTVVAVGDVRLPLDDDGLRTDWFPTGGIEIRAQF